MVLDFHPETQQPPPVDHTLPRVRCGPGWAGLTGVRVPVPPSRPGSYSFLQRCRDTMGPAFYDVVLRVPDGVTEVDSLT